MEYQKKDTGKYFLYFLLSLNLGFLPLADVPFVYGSHQVQGPPTNVIATPGDGQVDLSWDITINTSFPPVTDYIIKYNVTGSTLAEFDDGTNTLTTATVTGLTNGVSYDFTVLARNSDGDGLQSEVVAATPFASRTLTDSVTASDTISRVPSFPRTLTDSVTASDTISRVPSFSRTLTDSISISDSIQTSTPFSRTLSDTLTSSDNITIFGDGFTSFSDTFDASDTISSIALFARTLTDSVTVSDTISTISIHEVSLSDTITSSDNTSTATTYSVSLSDTLTSSDNLSADFRGPLSETVSMSDTIRAGIAPSIISITASDPNGGNDTGYSDGDTITVVFSEATNRPFAGTLNQLTKQNLDSIFSYDQGGPASLGANYTGTYLSPSILQITIQDSTGATPPTVGNLILTVKGTAFLRNEIGFSPPSTAVSPALVGNFGSRAGPFITDLVADDPDGGTDLDFSIGDTITVRFSESTNQPSVATTAALNALLTFSQNGLPASLGTSYTGVFTNPSILVITIQDSTGATPPSIGRFTVTVNESAGLKNAAGTSLASTATSPVLSGKFETFFALPHVNNAGDTVTATLPSGLGLAVTSPRTGTFTFVRSDASNILSGGSTVGFLGEVVNITPPLNACALTSGPGCTFAFTFTDDDLNNLGLELDDIRIFHDRSIPADDDFADIGETLATTVVPSSPPGPYIATAQDNFTSKFAVGGIRPALLLGGLSGEFSPPSFSGKAFAENEFPLTINGAGYKLDQYSNVIPTISLETGTPVQIKTLLYDPGGVSTIQHLALYMNLRGATRDVQYSDTYIIYDKSAPTTISDPNGFFDDVKVTTTQVGNKLELSFDVTFAKPMAKSDIILRMWDDRRNNADTKIFDAIIVTGSEVVPSVQEPVHESTMPEPVQTEETRNIIPSWIKSNAGWWKDGQIDDSDFVEGIQYLIRNDIMKIPETEKSETGSQQIPAWIKNNAGWWRDGLISDSDFVSGIQWLISNGIMRI